ncbi:MAG: heavy metal translocating P-type ATPase [Hyphomicrobiaceae bacterium]
MALSHAHDHSDHRGCTHAPNSPEAAVDPVCGMSVGVASAKHTYAHRGETYYFCSSRCKSRFEADPERFLDRDAKARAAADEKNAEPQGILYTCPMHPEVVQDGPGTCPKCGMALEPMGVPPADEGPNPELVDFRHRFLVGAILSLPLVAIAMAPHVGIPVHDWVPPRITQWIELLLATPVVVWCGLPFIERGVASIRNRSPNMWTLIATGVITAYLYSVVAVLAPGIFPVTVREHGGVVGVYFEAAAVIIVLVLLGQILELRARDRTGAAIRALMDLAPKTALRITDDGAEAEVAVDALVPGDKVRIRPGEAVPVDGSVLEGHSGVDEQLVTGEPLPVDKSPGDKLTGGTLNRTGSLVMTVERVGADTMLARIVEMVATAQRTRAPIQGLADKVAGYLVPAVVGIAMIAFLAWLLIGPPPALAHAVIAAVSVLIIACPCALGLATPISIMMATGRGARSGILIRNAEALERLASVDTLVVDKTGTLTAGRPVLTDVKPYGDTNEQALLHLAASLERGSEHPLAQAIVAGARARNIALVEPEAFDSVPGKGARGAVGGQDTALGNAALMQDLAIAVSHHDAAISELRRDGKTALYVSAGGRLAGILALADEVKPTTPAALSALTEKGLRVIMVTGDAGATAEAVARKLGITEVYAGVLPEGKAELVRRLKAEGRRVAVAGDGVNDAPALAAADVGIAMGTGADVAKESAGITLPEGDLMGIVRARRLAEATLANIRQNLAFAFGYNAIGVPLAAGVLYPLVGWLLSPMIAAAAMSLSSVSVIGNALRLGRADIDTPQR